MKIEKETSGVEFGGRSGGWWLRWQDARKTFDRSDDGGVSRRETKAAKGGPGVKQVFTRSKRETVDGERGEVTWRLKRAGRKAGNIGDVCLCGVGCMQGSILQRTYIA